jgi:hypothetical protein
MLTVVGILDRLELRDASPRTVGAPALVANSNQVSSGVFVTLRTSEEIFSRRTLTDALVIAPKPEDVPSLVERLREAFRLEPGVFVSERYGEFSRKVHDFAVTLALFSILAAVMLAANLLHDVYVDRRRQDAILMALGSPPSWSAFPGVGFGLVTAAVGALSGSLVAVVFTPHHFVMPSLMADLGTIAPSFDRLVALAATGVPAVALGIAPSVPRRNFCSRRPSGFLPLPPAAAYDIPGAEPFSHDGELCSFDAFLNVYGVEDPALDALALIVRGADTARLDLTPQSPGLLAISLGLSAIYGDDHDMLARGMIVYDALYAWCRDCRDQGHDWNPAAIGLMGMAHPAP